MPGGTLPITQPLKRGSTHSHGAWILIIIIAIVITSAVAVWFLYFQKNQSVIRSSSRDSLPSLIATTKNSVQLLTWSNSEKKYSAKQIVKINGNNDWPRVTSGEKSFYFGDSNRITHYSMSGEKLNEWVRPGARETNTTKNRNYYIDAIATEAFDRGNLYVGADGKFFSLNANLEEQFVLDLPVRKNADDILIEGNTAYLLDDEYAPFYAFTVDISNSKETSIKGNLKFGGVNEGLDEQWLDRDGKKWYMADSSTTSGGSSYSIRVIDIATENPYQLSQVNTGSSSSLLGMGGNGWKISSDLDYMDGYFLVERFLKDANESDEPSRYVRISHLTSNLQPIDEYELPKSVWPTGSNFGFQMKPFQYGGIFHAGDKFSLLDFSSTQPTLLYTGAVQDLTNIIQAPGE